MRYKSSFIAILFLLIIPIIGYFIANAIINDLDSGKNYSIVDLCFSPLGHSTAKIINACNEIKKIHYLKLGSIITGSISIGLIILYVLISIACGTKRKLISLIFPILVPLTTLIVSGLILIQGVIITYGAYIGESYLIGRVHLFLIGALGIGALIGSLKLLSSLFSFKTKPEFPVFGKLILQKDNEKIWTFVKNIASDLNARIPDNIIVGLEPTFFATSANVKLINDNKLIKGETLFLSVVLMRLFTKSELKSVIGHELGHFRGDDTSYSMKFAPVYSGMQKSIKSIDGSEGETSIVTVPAVAMLSAMLDIFSMNVLKISRIREFEADKAGISVSSSEDFGIALGKVATFSLFWNKVRDENINRLNQGKISGNLSEVFEDSSKYDLSVAEIETIVENILETKITHPTDTHPSISDRYAGINFDIKGLTIKKISIIGNSLQELFPNSLEIEKELTVFEHRFLIALGVVSLPEDVNKDSSNFLNTIYTLAATMIGADGKIVQSEIKSSEQIGKKLFNDFDSVDFRNVCKNLDSLPNFQDIIDLLKPILEEDLKIGIYNYLNEIANSDNDLAKEEKKILQIVKHNWDLKI